MYDPHDRGKRALRLWVSAFAAAISLAACGGGSSSLPVTTPTAKPSVSPTPAPTPTPTPTPPPATTSSSTIGGQGTTLNFAPVTGGISASVSLPGATSGAGATVSATLSLTPPGSVASPQSLHKMSAATHTGVAYIAITTTQDVTLSGTVSLSFIVGTGTQQYYLASYLAPYGWQYAVEGPAVADATGKVTFTSETGTITIPANTTLVLALTKDTPGTLSVAPQSLSFLSLGASNGQALQISEAGYTAAFSSKSGDTNVVTVGPGDVPGTLWVVPVSAGSTTITVTDVYGQSVSIPVTVTTTPVTIQ